MQEKFELISSLIVDYSIDVVKGERVLISYDHKVDGNFIKLLIEKILNKGGSAFVKIKDQYIDNLIMEKLNMEEVNLLVSNKKFETENYDAFISINYNNNAYNNKNMNVIMRNKMGALSHEIDDIRINDRKWVLLNYPSVIDASRAHMTDQEFFDYAMDTMCLDYNDLYRKMLPLKELMEKTDKVRIVAPNTDITFSIKGIPAVICAGKYNLPDGEVYTAPVKDSVNGKITYNTTSTYFNSVFSGVSLEFKDGKIINATCDGDNEKLNSIFDTDSGSRYVGEFAIGVNPMIRKTIDDILFDEKIYGSIHFTPGMAYRDAYNGNSSSVHWDLVLIQTSDMGGGEIYFDDVLIRKDGKFVIDELKELNFNE